MGRFSTKGRGGRGDKTTSGTTANTGSAEGQRHSWSKTPVVASKAGSVDGDSRAREQEFASGHRTDAQGGRFMAMIGQSIVFKGELTGDEDLEIDGQVEGTVHLENHQLTIGANGNLKAEVIAKSIIVIGRVKGNLIASERIDIQASGIVEGDVRVPRLNVQEGAILNGSIDMSARSDAQAKKPVSQASASSTPTSTSTSPSTPTPPA